MQAYTRVCQNQELDFKKPRSTLPYFIRRSVLHRSTWFPFSSLPGGDVSPPAPLSGRMVEETASHHDRLIPARGLTCTIHHGYLQCKKVVIVVLALCWQGEPSSSAHVYPPPSPSLPPLTLTCYQAWHVFGSLKCIEPPPPPRPNHTHTFPPTLMYSLHRADIKIYVSTV